MCLGGSVDPGPPQWMTRKKVEPYTGPLPPEMVNDMIVSDTGDFTRKNDLKIEKPAAQSSKQYGGPA